MELQPVPSILLVDDDELVRDTFGLYFSQNGWVYDLVADGASALSACSKKQYDLIITDLVMPGLDGLELLRSIRKIKPEQVVLVVTAYGGTGAAVQCLREGAIDIISKPVDLHLFRETVSRVMSSLRESKPEVGLYHCLTSEKSIYEFCSADCTRISVLPVVVEQLCRAGIIDIKTKLKIELAFQEALTNSVEHGNLELESLWKEEIDVNGVDRYSRVKVERLKDPKYADRKIRLTAMYEPGKLTIAIEDQGQGFKVNLEKRLYADDVVCHGRGLMIILGTMDELRYSKDGRAIEMVKYLNT